MDLEPAANILHSQKVDAINSLRAKLKSTLWKCSEPVKNAEMMQGEGIGLSCIILYTTNTSSKQQINQG